MQPGTILAGKYRLDVLLGEGGMGAVWRADHLTLKAPVAVKLIGGEISKVPDALARFEREANAAASLRSPHVVQILDHGVDDATGTPYIAMELLEGQSLAERLRVRGYLTPAETVRIVTHVSRALARAHAGGIVHRDLKPDNVFLVANDDEEIAKVLDFGIAKHQASAIAAAVTSTGTVIGTANYMSPEQITGSKLLDHRADLWSLGVIAAECLTGTNPFASENFGELVLAVCTRPARVPSSIRSLPKEFDVWFERAVAKDREHRFQSAKELAQALDAVFTGMAPPLSGPVSQVPLTASAAELPFGTVVVSSAPRVDTGMPVSSTHRPKDAVVRRRRGWVWGLLGLAAVTVAAVAIFWRPEEPIDPALPEAAALLSAAEAPAFQPAADPSAASSSADGFEVPSASSVIASPSVVPSGAPTSATTSAPSSAVSAEPTAPTAGESNRRRQVAKRPPNTAPSRSVGVQPTPTARPPSGRDLLDSRQ